MSSWVGREPGLDAKAWMCFLVVALMLVGGGILSATGGRDPTPTLACKVA